MSKWLSRPLMIDHSSCSFQIPNLRLEESDFELGLPSPFTHMAMQCEFVRTFSEKFRDVNDNSSSSQIARIQDEIENWINSLPPVYSIATTDTTWDERYPYVVLQRHHMHAVAYMIKLDPLKPYLTGRVTQAVSDCGYDFRAIGVDCCLKLSESSRKLFEMDHPVHAPFHFVVFCIFDSAAILCSAIIHDSERNLPQRERALAIIEGALDILKQLSSRAKMGETSHSLLWKLVTLLPAVDKGRVTTENPLSSNRAKTNLPTPESFRHSPELPFTDLIEAHALQYGGKPEAEASVSTVDNSQWIEDPTLQQFDFSSFLSSDFGGLEQVWDWDSLNLDLQSLDPSISTGTTFP